MSVFESNLHTVKNAIIPLSKFQTVLATRQSEKRQLNNQPTNQPTNESTVALPAHAMHQCFVQ